MIESWILSKLTPLIRRPVIILRDPQRMIVSGAPLLTHNRQHFDRLTHYLELKLDDWL